MLCSLKEFEMIEKKNQKEEGRKLFWLSIGLLALGIAYYILFRTPILASTWVGVESIHQNFSLPIAINWLPSFVHQLGFVLLTWLVLERKHKWFSLLFWLGMNVVFELLQLFPKHNYFISGTYSHEDMIAIFVATVVAYILMKEKNETEIS